MIFLGLALVIVVLLVAMRAVLPRTPPNPNANEPDIFASEEADLDPESDTGEPEGRN
jgi:hypothetical protein